MAAVVQSISIQEDLLAAAKRRAMLERRSLSNYLSRLLAEDLQNDTPNPPRQRQHQHQRQPR